MGKIRDRIGGMGRFKDGSTVYIFVTNYRCITCWYCFLNISTV